MVESHLPFSLSLSQAAYPNIDKQIRNECSALAYRVKLALWCGKKLIENADLPLYDACHLDHKLLDPAPRAHRCMIATAMDEHATIEEHRSEWPLVLATKSTPSVASHSPPINLITLAAQCCVTSSSTRSCSFSDRVYG